MIRALNFAGFVIICAAIGILIGYLNAWLSTVL